MKFTILFFASLAAVLAAPQLQQVPYNYVPVIQRTEVRDHVGQFALSFVGGDGTQVSEQGALKLNSDGTDNVLVKQGSYSYTSPEGIPITLNYVADELGFRPVGAHLPQPVQPIQ